MAIAAVRRIDACRADTESFMETRYANPRLAALIGASARQRPTVRYDDVLIDARERIAGDSAVGTQRRWKEAAMAVHQGRDEMLTDFLFRLEVALNDFAVNDPLEATPDMVYSIYRASLSDKTKELLERNHALSTRARAIGDDERIELIRQCLYCERRRESQVPVQKIRSVSTKRPQGPERRRWAMPHVPD